MPYFGPDMPYWWFKRDSQQWILAQADLGSECGHGVMLGAVTVEMLDQHPDVVERWAVSNMGVPLPDEALGRRPMRPDPPERKPLTVAEVMRILDRGPDA